MKEWDLHKLADGVWSSIRDWEYFQRDEVGQQVAKAAEALLQTPTPQSSTSIPIDDDEDDPDEELSRPPRSQSYPSQSHPSQSHPSQPIAIEDDDLFRDGPRQPIITPPPSVPSPPPPTDDLWGDDDLFGDEVQPSAPEAIAPNPVPPASFEIVIEPEPDAIAPDPAASFEIAIDEEPDAIAPDPTPAQTADLGLEDRTTIPIDILPPELWPLSPQPSAPDPTAQSPQDIDLEILAGWGNDWSDTPDPGSAPKASLETPPASLPPDAPALHPDEITAPNVSPEPWAVDDAFSQGDAEFDQNAAILASWGDDWPAAGPEEGLSPNSDDLENLPTEPLSPPPELGQPPAPDFPPEMIEAEQAIAPAENPPPPQAIAPPDREADPFPDFPAMDEMDFSRELDWPDPDALDHPSAEDLFGNAGLLSLDDLSLEELDGFDAFEPSPEPSPAPKPEGNPPLEAPADSRNPEGYQYFVTEAQDLLVTIEQELLALHAGSSTADIYSLMRATHTLKGASANVGCDTITTIAHNIEDVFRAMLAPEAVIDQELQGMLFEGYECLRLALSAELGHEHSQDDDLLNRAADLLARFQVKLGDCFNQQQPLPSSAEMGFDLTQSIFEVGVQQRIEELQGLIAQNPDGAGLAEALQGQAEVFIGLGESLGLPEFTRLAQTIQGAIATQPESIEAIAALALADLQTAQTQVLGGDRTQGATLSPAWQQYSPTLSPSPTATPTDNPLPLIDAIDDAEPESSDTSTLGNSGLPSLDDIFGVGLILPETGPKQEMSGLFEGDGSDDVDSGDREEPDDDRETEAIAPSRTATPVPDRVTLASDLWDEVVPASQTKAPPPQTPPQNISTAPPVSKTLRIELDQLEHLNHLVGELLINQNQLALRDEQFQTSVQKLSDWLRKHRLTLAQLRSTLPSETNSATASPVHRLLYAALEETSQITQATEDMNLLVRTTASTIEREQRLSKQLRDNMEAARMMPIEGLLKRFPPMVKQLSFVNKKPVTLTVRGTGVLIDKTITENLYDALLHLVRNAFDHGIESVEARRAAGKPEQGQIEIAAYNQGNRTIIEVRDDGQGLKIDRICQRAIANHLISKAEADEIRRQPHPEERLLDLLCAPGFSTTDQVSDLSGRGVGLDVVKTQLAQIKGTLQVRRRNGVESGNGGQGTIFSLQIRESLLSARLLICQAGSSVYGFVSNEIEQVLIPGEKLRFIAGQKVLDWNQEEFECTVPVYELASLFKSPARLAATQQYLALADRGELQPVLSTPQNITPVLLLRTTDGLIGLEVQQVIEESELVIKPISDAIAPPPYLYGCSILADGRLTLVIDGAMLVQHTQKQGMRLIQESLAPARSQPAIASPALSTEQLGLYIPDAHPSDQHPIPTPPDPVETAAPIATILVVDDSLTERQTLSLMLKRHGKRVMEAKDGLEALEQLRSGRSVDAILCDIEMPRMNGLEFLSAARQDLQGANIPVLMLTSRSRDRFQTIALELGAAAYLTKPYIEQEILTTLDTALGRKRS
jgi:chemotaxis protein histidine kinase CheA/ActR/RegA family two-component response regulator